MSLMELEDKVRMLKRKVKTVLIYLVITTIILVSVIMNTKIYINADKMYIVPFEMVENPIEVKYERIDNNGNVLSAPIKTPKPTPKTEKKRLKIKQD